MAYDPATGLEAVEDTLQNSPTAYNDAATPTTGDIVADRKRRALEKTIASAGNKRLQERWYGDKNQSEPKAPNRPILEKALNALTIPAKAIVGTAQYTRDVIKGAPHESLAKTINQNIKQEGETWGGFLESLSIPGVVATPLGFAMDLALDPLNWMTMGTSAFIPKLGYGLKKAGLVGASLAVKQEAKGAAFGVLKHLSGLSLADDSGKALAATGAWAKSLPKGAAMREAFEKTAPLGLRIRSSVQKLADDSLAAGAKFDEVTGRDFKAILAKQGGTGPFPGLAKRPSAQVEQLLREKGMGSTVDFWKYSTQDWGMKMKAMDYQDILDGMSGKNFGEIRTADDLVRAEAELTRLKYIPLTEAVPEKITDAVRALDGVPAEAKVLVSQMSELADEGANVLQDMKWIRPETAARMEEFIAKSGMDRESIKLIRETMNSMRALGKNKTGMKAFDDAYAKAENLFKTKYSNVPIGKRVLDFMELTHKMFALMKVPLSPSAWATAIGGNPIMAHLSGINVLDPKYYQSLWGAFQMSRGKVDEKFFAKMRPFMQSIDEMTATMSGYAHKTLGYDPRYMGAMQMGAVDDAVKMAAKEGVQLTHEEVIRAMVDASQGAARTPEAIQAAKVAAEAIDKAEAASQIAKRTRAATQQAPKTASELRQLALEGKGDFALADLPGDFSTTEIYSGAMQPLLNFLKEKSTTSLAAKYAYAAATKPGSWYSQIDSVYKLGTWHHLIVNGLSEGEVRRLTKLIPGFNEGITGTVKSGANLRYTISPEKALDAVNEIYMQYAAMPTAVNVMRSIPIIGSPFIAFPYAMTTKVAKALAYNPAAFNKVSFFMDEAGGRKTPLEKEALAGKYYQHLNAPGFMRLEFFKDNPIYVNLTNVIPYYALNQLGPTERSFDSKWANVVAQAVDSSPFFKAPWGQAIIDDLLIPSLLSDSEAPEGIFGQKVWPIDATTGEKFGYAARNLGESFTPGIMGVAGVLAAKYPGLANPAFVEKIPNAKTRSMLYATQGKNSVGIQTRETPWQKVQRTMAGQLGASVTPVQVEFTQK